MILNSHSQWLPFSFLILIFVLALSSKVHQSPTTDEGAHLRFGRAVLLAPQLVTDAQRMPVTALNAIPDLLLERFVPKASSRIRLFAARSVTVVLSCALAWLVFLWSTQLWGWRGGLFSLGLYTFEPNLLAHARWVTNDMALSLFMLATVGSYLRYLKDPTKRNLVFCAVFAGCAQIAKHSALVLVPVLAVLTVIHLWVQLPSDDRWRFIRAHIGFGIRHVAAFGFTVVLVINVGYLFKGTFHRVNLLDSFIEHPKAADNSFLREGGVVHSLIAPLRAFPAPLPSVYVTSFLYGVHINKRGEGHGPNYLLGTLSRWGWWYYYLVALAFKLPIGLWLLLALSAVETVRRPHHGPVVECALLLAPIALIILMSSSTAQIGVRYVLPILPFLLVSVGRVVVDFQRRSRVYRSAVVVAFAWMVVSSLSFYPHYLSYFNELIGSRLNMYKILADSNVDWKQNDYYLEDYLRQNAGKAIYVNPEKPVTGTVVVNVNRLVGVTAPLARYDWLRSRHEPVGHIGYSWLIYDIEER
jgi:Dolichyl-phosphate-mannose-protein mannosyltransferase